MSNISWPRVIAAVLFSFVLGGALAASRQPPASQAELDRLIPREKWAGAGLDKLSTAEQQTLADDITALLASTRSTDNAMPSAKDRSQWRTLKRGMTKDDVKKVLGEPVRVSVTRFYESWYYLSGTTTFDGKGHLDSWTEN